MSTEIGNWTVYGFHDEVEALQDEAVREIAADPEAFDSRRRALNRTSRLIADRLIRGMKQQLQKWCIDRGVNIIDINEPWTRISVKRLRFGQTLFPREGRTSLLMPITKTPVRVRLIPRDKAGHNGAEFDWLPSRIMQLLNVGVRLRDMTTLPFVVITYRTGAPHRHLRFSPPTNAAAMNIMRNAELEEPWVCEDDDGRTLAIDHGSPPPGPEIFSFDRPYPYFRPHLPPPMPVEPYTIYKAVTYGPYQLPHPPTFLPHETHNTNAW